MLNNDRIKETQWVELQYHLHIIANMFLKAILNKNVLECNVILKKKTDFKKPLSFRVDELWSMRLPHCLSLSE